MKLTSKHSTKYLKIKNNNILLKQKLNKFIPSNLSWFYILGTRIKAVSFPLAKDAHNECFFHWIYVCFSITLSYMCYASRSLECSLFPIKMILVLQCRLKNFKRDILNKVINRLKLNSETNININRRCLRRKKKNSRSLIYFLKFIFNISFYLNE